MPAPICYSCRQSLQLRLRLRIHGLQQLRRPFHATAPARAEKNSLSLYWSTLPPTQLQLEAASWFFDTFHPNRLWTAEEWRKQNDPTPEQFIPEVAFLGRSNVGKSSLLNALLNKPGLNPVGPRPGKTVVMTAWGLSPTTASGGALPGFNGDTTTRLTVLDVPGYGFKSQGTWGSEITKYLSRRKHLRKVFVLVDANHGLVGRDKDMFELLRSRAIPHQVIASKADTLLDSNSAQKLHNQDLLLKIAHASQVKDPGELLVTAARRNQSNELLLDGIAAVRWSVLRAVGLDIYVCNRFSKVRKLVTMADEQEPEMNAPNPFMLPDNVYTTWVGGVSKPIMGGLPFLADQDPSLVQPSMAGTDLPSSHPRAPQKTREQPRPLPDLREGMDALLSQAQQASQIRSTERSTLPPLSPPPDPRSRTRTPFPVPRISPQFMPSSSAPRGLDALMSLTKSKPTSKSNTGLSAPPEQPPPIRKVTPNNSVDSPFEAPPITGPEVTRGLGVTRGLDAFISATQSESKRTEAQTPARRQRRYGY